MHKHTPGPWKVFKGNDRYPGIDDAAGNNTIVLFGLKDEFTGVRGETTEEAQANARLIAAAPEMLAELEKIANACEICEGFGIVEYQPSGIDGYLPTGDANFVTEDCPHCATVRAIIAKAKGETNE